jgi:hypothetical protein
MIRKSWPGRLLKRTIYTQGGRKTWAGYSE